MGNCSLKGVTEKNPNEDGFRVLTDWGAIIDFRGPKIVQDVIDHYPGHGIFRQGHASSQLPRDERLIGGHMYYLLPLRKEQQAVREAEEVVATREQLGATKQDIDQEIRRDSGTKGAELVKSLVVPSMEVLPRRGGNGVWKVKLVMERKQLEELLSQEVSVEALIEEMRMAASASASASTACSSSVSPKREKGSSARQASWKPSLANLFKVSF